MTQINIRPTVIADLPAVMDIYEYARKRMSQSGNATQWTNGYPSHQIVTADIVNGNSYVIEAHEKIMGVFTFIIGNEPNYSVIDGAWPDHQPYGTIHRIAAAPDANGIADTALDFCKNAGVNIRIDTHADNVPMLNWIAKRGFTYCGIIHVENGTPRRAFQLNLHD